MEYLRKELWTVLDVAIEFNDLHSESVDRGQALRYLSMNLAAACSTEKSPA